ncbi:hypothetical protein MAPG_08201 [Magnaporthiopsis poae ATCC 64411]|uniref:BRCT domain-containing protein n=1 Tax=Magnaporthiopsis poae (strain ATCC 64411 / 73-15) TaxID=644358 RepID=A0A0C4E6Q5_MAGP6|nr:hypothetical protein MAPG_08201 [Magnaporthiopsis poae ATCC 64411]
MASTPLSSDLDDSAFDPAHPFQGIVVCCTSIAPEQRSDLAAKTHELGGLHKYDLTPDVTHLIVGEYDTPKYRHVAKERPDILPMAAGWIQAVRDLWTKDAPINFRELEKAWRLKAFETDGNQHGSSNASINDRGRLLVCLTGFEDAHERQEITETVTANGGEYTGDLTRKVTHLVVNRPEGRKYAAAKTWGIHTVSIEWIRDSVERGMILDESRYDPLLPVRERGVGAWNRRQAKRAALGKRSREGSGASGAADGADDRKRKLRRTASQKLATQRAGLWGDILGEQQGPQQALNDEPAGQVKRESSPDAAARRSASRQPSGVAGQPPAGENHLTAAGRSNAHLATQATQETPGPSRFELAADRPAFHSCVFYIHGFSSRHAEILINTVLSLGGQTVSTLEELASAQAAGSFDHRILIVPQESESETHPQVPGGVEIVTEFFIEQCLHKRRFSPPSEHVIGRPFPRFPIVGFETLGISTSGFTGPDLNQVDKAIRQLGARYDERFTPKASLLVCTSVEAIRKQKLELALAWKVPVVKVEWLWECISTGFKVPYRDFMFPELKQSLTPPDTQVATSNTGLSWERRLSRVEMMSAPAPARAHAPASVSTSSSDLTRRQAQKASKVAINPIDTSAFDSEGVEAAGPRPKISLPARAAQGKGSAETAASEMAATRVEAQAESDSGVATTTRSREHSAPLSEVSLNSRNKPPSPKSHDQQPPKHGELPNPSTTAPTRKGFGRILSEVADSEAPDSSREQTPEVESEPQRPESRKPRDARPLKPDVQHSMSNQLASLLDGTATAAGLGVEGDGGGNGNARRRKRGIFGRAVSNASAGSDGSGSGPGGLASGSRESLGPSVREDEEDGKAADRPPPSTELVYDAPQSEYFRALLRTGGAPGTVSDGGDGGKLTLRDLQQHRQAAAAMGTRGAGSSRRTRQR